MPASEGLRGQIEASLGRILRPGRFDSFPTHPRDRDALLAVAAGKLERQRPYAEREINETLIAWLASVAARPDHVTLRRRMVDCGFLKRTPNGARYYLNYGRLVEVLGDPPTQVDASAILQGVLRDREERKRTHLLNEKRGR